MQAAADPGGLVDAGKKFITYPTCTALARWLVVLAAAFGPGSTVPSWLIIGLVAYAVSATIASLPIFGSTDPERRSDVTSGQILALGVLDIAAAAGLAAFGGSMALAAVVGLDIALMSGAGASVALVTLTVAVGASVAIAQETFPYGPGLTALALAGGVGLASACGTAGRRRAEQQIRAITRVLDAGSNLGTQFSLPDVLGQLVNLLRQFQEVVPWQNAVIYISTYDQTARENLLVPELAVGPHLEFYRSHKMRFNDGVIGYAATEQRPQVVGDIQRDSRDLGLPKPKSVRSVIVVPISSEDRAIGAVLLTSPHTNAYTFDQQRVIDRLVRVAAVGIQNAQLYSRTMELAETDSMTGLLTNRAFHERLETEFKRAQLTRQSLSLLILDVDYFKHVNDTYGHPQGDELLRQIGAIIKKHARKDDVCCRYGGDEFTVIMPSTVKAEAGMVAERLRLAVEEEYFQLESVQARITVSVGVAGYPQDCGSKPALIKCADSAMYAAKQDGRNNVKMSAQRELLTGTM